MSFMVKKESDKSAPFVKHNNEMMFTTQVDTEDAPIVGFKADIV